MLGKKGVFNLIIYNIMSNILKYYKNTFTLMLKLGFAWWAETGWAYEAIKEACNSWDFLPPEKWNELKNKYERKNPEDFKKALKQLIREWAITSTSEVLDNIDRIIWEWNDWIQEVTHETQVGLSNERETYNEVANPFNRTIILQKPYMRGKDVTTLLTYLTNNGYPTDWTKAFWPKSKQALKNFQKKVLKMKKPDWVMDLNGKTMRYILNHINSNYNKTRRKWDRLYWKEANDVVNALNDTKKFIDAFNHVYGWQGDLISWDNWLLWIVARLGWSSLSRLERELRLTFSNVNKAQLSKVLWIPQNSPRFKEWLVRTATTALISAIISWWSSTALELFGINYWHNYKPGPEINKILKALGRGNINMKKELQEALVSKNTTVEWVEAMYRAMKWLDKNNLKRFVEKVYNPHILTKIFSWLRSDEQKSVDNLMNVFNQTWTLEDAYVVVKSIYKLAHEKKREAKIKYDEALSEYRQIPSNILKKALDNTNIAPSYKVEDARKIIAKKDKAEEVLRKAEAWLGELWRLLGRYTNLHEKEYQIRGVRPDLKKYRAVEREIDQELNALYVPRKLKRVRERLHSKQSYSFNVDINKVNNPEYMWKLLSRMNKETINWNTSILAWVIRWVRQHYGINVGVKEFVDAMMYNAEKVDRNEEIYIASNTWRDGLQKFQWTIWNGELFKVYINWQYVYFKDKCTNIVTVVNNIPTTIDYASSLPVEMTINNTHSTNAKTDNGWSRPTDPTKVPKPPKHPVNPWDWEF